jgi:hypothetical protein
MTAAGPVIAIPARQAASGPRSLCPDQMLAEPGLDRPGGVGVVLAVGERFDISVPFMANLRG